MAVGHCYRLFCSWSLSDPDFYGYSYFRGSWRSPMAQTCSLEGVYFSVASLAGSVANEDKLGYSRHSFSRSCSLCDRLRWCWVYPTLISLMCHLRFSLATSSGLDWFFIGGRTQPLISFCSLHSFSCLCLGCVEWKKP
jgi:hypothetical protein